MASRMDSDALIAIRRLRRHLTVWRLLAIAAFAFAAFLLVEEHRPLGDEDHVARVYIEGLIVNDRAMIDMLDDIADDPSAKALIVEIDSPGGTFDGGEAMYAALRRVANEKPVAALLGGIATSGGYMTAIGADRIFTGYGTLTGSIGVIMQSADVTGLLDKIGITPETIKSGPLKATPNPAEKLTADARTQLQEVIDSLHLRFMEMVADRRGLSLGALLEIAGDGRVMTGARAVEVGLADEIGSYRDLRAWMTSTHEISADLPVIDWVIEDPLGWWRETATGAAQAIFGKSLLPERLRLDGIQALWQPFSSGER